MLVTDKREYLQSAGCWILLIKILTCSRPNGHKRTLSDADGHRTRPCVGWADIDTRGRLCRRTSQSPLEAATVTVGNTRHGDSATTEEERLLGLVSKTGHLMSTEEGVVEIGHHISSREGTEAKVVAVVSFHNRRLKETPSRRSAVTWLQQSHHLAATEWWYRSWDLRAVILLAAEELCELAKVVTLVPVLVSTLLVPASHTCVIVLQQGGGLREVSQVWDWSGRGGTCWSLTPSVSSQGWGQQGKVWRWWDGRRLVPK